MSISVTANIPYGNVCDVGVSEAARTTEVSFAADPHGGPESLWFCFRVEESGKRGGTSSKVKLTLKHSTNVLGGGRPLAFRPVVRAADGDWERLGTPSVEQLPDGRRLVSWVVDAPRRFFDVALCYPYGTEEVEALVRETGGFWRSDVIGVSPQARPLLRLSNDYGKKHSRRPGLYLTARQHSGETPGSWVLDGFLRQVATLGSDAPLVWAAPLTNIDGIERGDYGKDNFPYDLNRAWGLVPMRHETLVFQRDVARWRERCRPVLGLDFHAPGGTEKDGIYAFVPNPETSPEKYKTALAWNAEIKKTLTRRYAAEDFDRVAGYHSRWETPSFADYVCRTVDVCGYTFETSYALARRLVLTREDYRDAGKRIATAVMAKLRATV
jgi:hypothetical protein